MSIEKHHAILSILSESLLWVALSAKKDISATSSGCSANAARTSYITTYTQCVATATTARRRKDYVQ